MKKFYFILFTLLFSADVFAANIILGSRTLNGYLDQENTSDTPSLNTLSVFGIQFYGDWKYVGVVLNTTIGANSGSKKISETITVEIDNENINDLTRDIEEEVSSLATMLNLEFGIILKKTFLNFITPYVASGLYSTAISYNAADFDFDTGSIERISNNANFMDYWHAYGINFNIGDYFSLSLEQKTNLGKSVNFGDRQVNLGSSETNLIFNFGF